MLSSFPLEHDDAFAKHRRLSRAIKAAGDEGGHYRDIAAYFHRPHFHVLVDTGAFGRLDY